MTQTQHISTIDCYYMVHLGPKGKMAKLQHNMSESLKCTAHEVGAC